MIDYFNIPNSQQNVQVFYTNGSVNAWQTWQKPKKCNYVWIMCVGGGGGGAGGRAAIALPYSTGGAAGGVSRVLYNSQQLPDILYVQVGLGGAGGASGVAGSPATRSFVSIQPIIGSSISVAGSGTVAAAGGTSGTGASAAGESAPGQPNINLLTLSNFINTAGISAAGNSGTIVAPNLTPLSSQIVTAGAGGPSWNNSLTLNGASILASSISPLISGGTLAVGAGNNAGNGMHGITSWKPFFSTGGAGGGSADGGNGGNGGNGGIGSGGGAGGGCPSGSIAGTGGKGGDGIVIIISF